MSSTNCETSTLSPLSPCLWGVRLLQHDINRKHRRPTKIQTVWRKLRGTSGLLCSMQKVSFGQVDVPISLVCLYYLCQHCFQHVAKPFYLSITLEMVCHNLSHNSGKTCGFCGAQREGFNSLSKEVSDHQDMFVIYLMMQAVGPWCPMPICGVGTRLGLRPV